VEETFPTPYVYIFVIRILYIFLISIKYIFFIRITDPDQEFIYFRGSETLPSAYILSEKPTLRVTGIMKDEGNDDEKPKVRSTISFNSKLKAISEYSF